MGEKVNKHISRKDKVPLKGEEYLHLSFLFVLCREHRTDDP